MVEVAGIDGYRRGWVAVVLVDGRFERAIVAKRLADLAERLDASGIIGVDVPIGLPESGARAADLEAARVVGPRRSSVFPTPPRAVWEAADIDTARRLSIALTGKSIASQTFALRERVLEADVVAKSDSRIREVHPEVSFRAIAGRSLMAPKACLGPDSPFGVASSSVWGIRAARRPRRGRCRGVRRRARCRSRGVERASRRQG